MPQPYQHIFTESDRQRMLADIAHVAITIGRDLFPEIPLPDADIDTFFVATSPEPVPAISPRERVAYLLSLWTRLETAFRRIEQAPDTILVPERRAVPLEKARRAMPKDLLFAMTRIDPNSRGGRRVQELVTVPSPDTPANKLIKGILTVWLREMTVAAELAAVGGARSVERDALYLRDRIRRVLRRSPWQSLIPAPGNALPPLPQSVRQLGPYRLIYDTYRHYRRGFCFDWQNPIFQLPPREMWLLYEYWCLFQVGKALRGMGFRAVSAEGFLLTRSGLTFSLVRGHPSALTFVRPEGGQKVRMTYSPHIPAPSLRQTVKWRSRSHAMRPDIVLECEGRLLVLDAKFKTYAESAASDEEENLPLTADINQCHAYRDGILCDGHPCVSAAWLLYPGRIGGINRAVISYGASNPPTHSEVGAILLRPALPLASLMDLFTGFVENAT